MFLLVAILIFIGSIYIYFYNFKYKANFNKSLSDTSLQNDNSCKAIDLKFNGVNSQILIDSPELLWLQNLNIDLTFEQMAELIENIKKEIQNSQLNVSNNNYMVPLCVSFADKDCVKNLGASWCYKTKSWFTSFANKNLFAQWLPLIYQLDYTSPYIVPNLVPQCLWGINLRSILSTEQWQIIKGKVTSNSGYRCKICGCKGLKWPVECHEDWQYLVNNKKGIVRLKDLKSICTNCHNVIHYGRAQKYNKHSVAVARLIVLNEWSLEKAEQEIFKAFNKWDDLSKIENWSFDIEILNNDYYTFK